MKSIKPPRNAVVEAMRKRYGSKAGPMKHRLEPKGGAVNEQSEFLSQVTPKLVSCDECLMHAVWFYMPMDARGNTHYCDDCIPRDTPCSCNNTYDEEYNPTGDYLLDDKGRNLPCCEWMFYENGRVFEK